MLKYILSVAIFAIGCFGVTAEESQPIFNGKNLDNWTLENGDPVPDAWFVEDGVIGLDRSRGRSGNIVTKEEYGDFDLSFEWKVEKGGNNGIKYRVNKFGYQMLGPEYQMLDDPNTSEGRNSPKNSAGSLYDIKAPNDKKELKPNDEWNSARIVVNDNTIEHYMNGELIVSIEVGSDEWKELIAKSKFNNTEGFGENERGKIMITDHTSKVWIKEMKIKSLSEE